MPVLLRRSASTFTVEELADGYSRKRLGSSRSELGSSRRISAPEEFRAQDITQCRTPSRSEPPAYAQPAPAVDKPGVAESSKPLVAKPMTFANIVNQPNLMSALANELHRLPKTYVRLCWDRITTSFASVRTARQRKQAKVSSDTDPTTTTGDDARPSSTPSSPTTSEASNVTPRSQFPPQA
ncbi:hypothetical protein H257_01086 [Aphanomyces astaci]|uniref:Uncharacterized protein n=1 Tax=Aphanomyces astaci TaxID=112090 RepID=W4H6Q3_APHAT|nr:hypothetical protein H257_01086 [Aphanomyces astaci]ETV87547.1 hypothetical protein H257_01086 [Aphanomyces astaci]RQM28070.1 hypothetical protein B5M09_011926 [Aphanomyces astaci]|eukprot:XP_009822411.1 hypothetical protein H257_01086 [Aphanomyces astaci]